MYGREITRKIHTCEVSHKEGNEALGSVGMRSGGCRGMHEHAANAKQNKKSDLWVSSTYFVQACVWGKWP